MNKDENPYNYNLGIYVGAHVSHEDLKSLLANLAKVPKSPREGMCKEIVDVDKDIIANRLLNLQ